MPEMKTRPLSSVLHGAADRERLLCGVGHGARDFEQVGDGRGVGPIAERDDGGALHCGVRILQPGAQRRQREWIAALPHHA